MPVTARSSFRNAGSAFGEMLREWRRLRGASQLDLALTCGLSQKHLSFLESGRSRPSRGMVLHLASVLGVPLFQQNAMLLAAGFAPVYKERTPDAPDMQPIERALTQVLEQQEPFPALVVDGAYNVLRANRATAQFLGFLLGAPAAPAAPLNVVELVLREDALRPYIEDWEEVATWMVRRVSAQALLEGEGAESELLQRVMKLPDVAALDRAPPSDRDMPPTLVTRFRKGATRLALFSMITTLGTPLDVALQRLHVELFFPADDATEQWFREAAARA
ncbi:MAG TPA: helix-turn-helix transcriptional regulator [Burkholderiales bacterium]